MTTVKTYPTSDFPTELFLQLTKKIYGIQRTDKLPRFKDSQQQSYFLFDNEEVLATATIYLNPAISKDGNQVVLIGNFESTECDCSELFSIIEEDAGKDGFDQLVGPMNGSTWNEHRFILEDHGVPFLSEMTHPSYYPNIWRKNNFHNFQSYYSYRDAVLEANDARLVKLEHHFEALKLRFRTIDLSNFENELSNIYQLCRLAFRENVLYSEISKERFIASYLPLKAWLNEEYIWIAENEKNECVGFLFAFENKLNSAENELVVKTIAKHPSFSFNGLGTFLGNYFMKKALKNGVTSVIHAFMHENNVSKNLSQRFNGEKIRTYVLMTKKILRQ